MAADDLSTDQLANHAHQAISDGGEKVDDEIFDRLARRLSYVADDVTDDALYGPIVEHLGKAGLVEHARVAMEKPFGHDLDSARELNVELHTVLREDQILRVDHFLGKEPVIELEYLRFANLAHCAATAGRPTLTSADRGAQRGGSPGSWPSALAAALAGRQLRNGGRTGSAPLIET